MKRLIFLVLALSSITVSLADRKPEQLNSGTKFPSPDGKWVLVYNPDSLEVRDARTNQLYCSVGVTPLYAVRWTGDSKSFITVDQISHGSDAVVTHLTRSGWLSFVIDPPGEDWRDSAVIDVKAQQDFIEVSYAVRNSAIYILSFRVNPATKEMSNIVKTKITVAKWMAIDMFGDKLK